MSNGNFDEIRDILRQSAEQQLRTQQNIDRLNQAQTTTQQNIDRLADQFSQAQTTTQQNIDRLAGQLDLAQTTTQQNIDRLNQAQTTTQQNIDRLADQFSQAQTTTQQNIDRLADRIDSLAGWSDTELQRLAEETVSMISSLAHDLDALSSNVNAYITQSTAFLAAEQRDRAEFRQQMIGLQTETRNILRELADLRRQQGNGH